MAKAAGFDTVLPDTKKKGDPAAAAMNTIARKAAGRTNVKGGATLDHRGGGKLDHPAVEWLNAAVRRRGQDAGAAAGWRAFLLCSRR